MKSVFLLCLVFSLFSMEPLFGQQRDLGYFINHALQNDPGIRQNVNQQQFYGFQSQMINAQNKLPQVNFTSDYVFVPYFGSNGHAISITPNPSDNAFGYDIGLTNGGTYATQLNVTVPLFNKKTIKELQDQNTTQGSVNSTARLQLEHDLRKAVTDQYIQVYLAQQQEEYIAQLVEEVKNRKATVEALVKRGLLQQSDYLLLEIEQNTHENDLSQAQIAEVSAYSTLKNLSVVTDSGMLKLSEPVIPITSSPDRYFYKEKFRLDSLNLAMQQTVYNSKYRPTLELSGNGGMLASDFTNIPHNVGFEAMLHLNVPIYDGKQRKINDSEVKIAQQSVIYARDNFTVQQKNYLQSLRKQIDLFARSAVQIQLLISKQELLLQLDREKLQNGQLSILEYVKSLQDYAAAKQNYIAAKVQLLSLTNQYNYYNW